MKTRSIVRVACLSFCMSMITLSLASAADKMKPAKKEKPVAKKVMKIGNKKVGDYYVCPVAGDEVADVAKAPRSEYKGKTYLFCCPKCKAPFDKSPQKFAKADDKKEMPKKK